MYNIQSFWKHHPLNLTQKFWPGCTLLFLAATSWRCHGNLCTLGFRASFKWWRWFPIVWHPEIIRIWPQPQTRVQTFMVTYGPPSVAGEKQSLLAQHDVLNHRYVGLSMVYWHTLDLRALLEYGILPCLCSKFQQHCLTQIFTFSGGVECLRETGRESYQYVKHMMLLNVWLENQKTMSINNNLMMVIDQIVMVHKKAHHIWTHPSSWRVKNWYTY